jgi:hypothetical protein
VISIERLGTFEEILEGRPPELADLAHRLRALIAGLHPDVVEVPRTGEGVAAYGWGEKKMSESYAYLAPQRAWVNLGFYHGVLLDDPAGIVEGTGARIRHVKVRPDAVDEVALRALLVQARQERAEALGR